MVYIDTRHLGRPYKDQAHCSLTPVPMAADECPAGQLATGTICFFVWKPVESHMCCSQMWSLHQHFPNGGSVMVLPAKSCPVNWGHLARWTRLCACAENRLATEKIRLGEAEKGKNLYVCACTCVCLSRDEGLSRHTLYLRYFFGRETKRLCVLSKVLCVDCKTHPGKPGPKPWHYPRFKPKMQFAVVRDDKGWVAGPRRKTVKSVDL